MIPRTTVDLGANVFQAIKRVTERNQYVKGVECNLLEEEFSKYQKVKYGAGVNSGTSALHLALLALGAKPGDEIITVSNTFAATANAIILTGAKPIFVDIDPKTYNINVSKIIKAITPKTKIIIPIHLYGLMAEMAAIMEIAEERGLSVLEDACQAHGAECFDKRAGEFGDAAAFSFFPTKNVTVAGDGGIVLSKNEVVIEKVKILRNHGRQGGKHICAGFNNRLSEILAAIGREHLTQLDLFNNHRKRIAGEYKKILSNVKQIELPYEPENYKHVFHLFTIKAERRDELRNYLGKQNISTGIMYQEKLNELEYMVKYAGKQHTPINDGINTKILSLPISGTLSLENIETICNHIKEFFRKR